MQAQMLSTHLLIPDPHNPRQHADEECKGEMLESIKRQGMLVPLIVYPHGEKFMIGDGHQRYDIALHLDMKEVPVVIYPHKPSEAELLMIQLTINGHRQSLNPVDEYEAFARLAKLNQWRASDLATHLAVSNAEITLIQAIGKLTPEERQLVRAGKIPKSTAYALSRMAADARAALVLKAAAGEISRDELNARARKKQANPQVKTSRISCPLAGSTVSVQAPNGLNLAGFIELLESLVKECKKARSQGLDISTAVRVLRDRARAQPTA